MTLRHFAWGPTWLPIAFFALLAPAGSIAQTTSQTCLDCHDDATMVSDAGRPVGIVAAAFQASIHGDMDCTDCHSAPGNYDDVPHYKKYTPVDCSNCHDDAANAFQGSVHEDAVKDRDMTCTTCHTIHEHRKTAHEPLDGCGDCHETEAADYTTSVHRAGRKQNGGAATCASCHGSHHVLAVADSTSPVNERNIPLLCGGCHAKEPPVTADYVRLPVVVPGYMESVHGRGWQEGKHAAICTSCHGSHDSRLAADPNSHINRRNVARTCGQCHEQISAEYQNSIHGSAVALGVEDAPTCNDCHSEHLIRGPHNLNGQVSAEHRAKELCGTCHTDPEILSKYGIAGGVVESYLDSYHGWAVSRGASLVATCTDCHNVHEIRSTLDPASTVNDANVAGTCSRCHPGATERFAQSYTHAGALEARGPHGWVRYIYLWLIAVVLGGMAIHNAVIARWEMRRHLSHVRREPAIQRWRRAERMQHIVLLLSFTALAVTGFALRFPTSWWARLIHLDGHELVRAYLHRSFAVIMTVTAIYHGVWLTATRRGRWSLREMVPGFHDMRQAGENMAFHLGLRRTRPAFRAFDYTQKAEYWAVVWGTWVMALTGLILWYPTVATRWFPVWIVRVSETIHFYEAILAVSAIALWHFFFVIFLPTVYPMSTTWIDGRMPAGEWKEFHAGQYAELGEAPIEAPVPGKEEKSQQN
jgi:cytochrome b subunit of formate dehydrogenase